MAETLKMADIHVGMRLKRLAAPENENHMLVTEITERGFQFSIPDDQEIIHPHWSMTLERHGGEWFGYEGDSLCVEVKPDGAEGK